jgi:hypothetical protein
MPANVNFNIPFNPGQQLGSSISEQILAGLHQGFAEKLQAKNQALEEQRVKNETARDTLLNQYTQKQIEHQALATAFEKETDPIKKQQALQELNKSAFENAQLEHGLQFFGVDTAAIRKSIGAPEAEGAAPAKDGETTPFQKQMQKTEKLLGPFTPDEQAVWDNAKEVAAKSVSVAPISAAMAKIVEQRQAIHKAELETTPFKDWKGEFQREHGRPPNAAEIEHFQTLPARVSADTKLEVNSKEMYDTKDNTVVQMNSKEINDANQKERGRFIQYTGQVQNALKAHSNVNDIRDGIAMMRDAINTPGFTLSKEARALMTLANKAPEHALEAVMSGIAAEHLTGPEQSYVIAHATLVDRSFSLKGLQSQGGGGSDSQRAAIAAMVPGFATADKGMAEKYLKTLENNIRNVEKAYPKIGSSGTSAREEAPAKPANELTPEQEAEKFMNKKP